MREHGRTPSLLVAYRDGRRGDAPPKSCKCQRRPRGFRADCLPAHIDKEAHFAQAVATLRYVVRQTRNDDTSKAGHAPLWTGDNDLSGVSKMQCHHNTVTHRNICSKTIGVTSIDQALPLLLRVGLNVLHFLILAARSGQESRRLRSQHQTHKNYIVASEVNRLDFA